MNRRLVATAAGVAAVAGLWLGSTAYFGQRTQRALEAQLAPWQAASPQGTGPREGERVLRVTGVRYERSLLGATRTVEVALGCGAEALHFSWRDDIRHGPLPGFAGLGAARIDSQLLLSPEQQQHWKALTGQDRPDVRLRTWVGLGGSSQSQADLPALRIKTAEGGELRLERASGELRVDRSGRAKFSAVLPLYSFSAPMGEGRGQLTVSARDLRMESEGLAPAWWALTGNGQGRVGRMEVALQDPATPNAPARTLLALDDLTYTQGGRVEQGLYAATLALQGKGQAGGLALDAVSLKMRMERLHAEGYATLVQRAYAGSCPVPGADPLQAVQPLLDGMAALLPHNPALQVEELQLTVGGKTARLAYGAGVQGVTADDLKAPQLAPVLMKKAQFNAELDVALPLIAQLANALERPLPPDALEQSVERAAAQGLLVRDGERVRARFEYRQGSAQLNGKPMPLPGLGAGAAPGTPPTTAQ